MIVTTSIGLFSVLAVGGAVYWRAKRPKKPRIGVRNGKVVIEGPPAGTASSGASVNAPSTNQAAEAYDFGRFSLTRDVLHSNTAIRENISNAATPGELRAAEAVAQNFLIPLDRRTNGRVRVTSWFRSYALNQEIGGEAGSQHTRGEAVDFYVEGMDRNDLYNLIREMVASGEIKVDQAILYNRNSRGPNVHASFTTRRTNRTKYTYRQANGSYVNYTGQVA